MPGFHPHFQQATGTLVQRKVVRGDFEALYEGVRTMRNHILPGALVSTGDNRCADDTEIRRLPVRADDEVVTEVLHVIFELWLARQYGLEMERRIVGVCVPPLALLGTLERNEQVFLGAALAHTHVVAVVFFLVDERVLV